MLHRILVLKRICHFRYYIIILKMADVKEDLLDYKEEQTKQVSPVIPTILFTISNNSSDLQTTMEIPAENGVVTRKEGVKGTYVSIHSSGFRDFLLKPEILRAIVDCGFEHPSEVQHECIPQVETQFLIRY